MSDLDIRIRDAVHERPLDEHELDLLYVRSRALARTVPVQRRRARHVRRAPLLAAVLVLGIAGAAAAAQHERIQRIFGQDEPLVVKVDQLRDESAERPTQAEYERLVETTMVPGVSRIGIIRDDEMVQKYRLEPIDKARVLHDDGKVVRVVAAPIVGGSQWCYAFLWYRDGVTRPGSGGCGGAFGPNGIAPGWGVASMRTGDPARYSFYGTASDDVTRIEVELDDGTREPVMLAHNVFVWSSLERPKLAHVWRGRRHDIERAPLGW